MKVAVITPTQYISGLSSYHMALGQELVNDPEYFKAYANLIRRGDFVVVDNGAAEPENERVPFDKILRAANMVGADEIVLPDVLRDKEATIEGVQKWAPSIEPRRRMVVPQGQDWEEWQACLIWYVYTLHEFRSIGVPKLLEAWSGGRMHALDIIRAVSGADRVYDIHFLGIWDEPILETSLAARSGIVRGIDTGAPLAYAQAGRAIDDYGPHVSVNWNQLLVHTDPMTKNIVRLLEVANAYNPRREWHQDDNLCVEGDTHSANISSGKSGSVGSCSGGCKGLECGECHNSN